MCAARVAPGLRHRTGGTHRAGKYSNLTPPDKLPRQGVARNRRRVTLCYRSLAARVHLRNHAANSQLHGSQRINRQQRRNFGKFISRIFPLRPDSLEADCRVFSPRD
ncbi:uncharacterized protein LOC122537832 [Frieseomelitta varia]|uniref:uncharacterized protein LOC122537832 n=1 Tax=Frieseomelitta varia TaxID=561572 RepID=UPI001CB6B3AD|nr:uncharacterized protein LOC122537832 [Frieseomelitta varia]